MKKILANLSQKQLKELDKLVGPLGYSSRSQAIRDAVRLLLKSESSPKLKEILQRLQEKSEEQERVSARQIETKILHTLEKNRYGLSLFEISKISGLHRHTVRKYVRKLVADGLILKKRVGVSTICTLKKRRVKL